MQQVICFFISVFLFSSLFVSSSGSLVEKHQNRIAKQDLNLSGRDIVNYVKINEGVMVIKEEEYLKNLENSIGRGEVAGGIFYYNDCITVLKKNGENYIAKKINAASMNDINKRNTINNFVDYLLENKETQTTVNIAVENDVDYLTGELFNKIEENTVFVIGKMEKNVYLSGFVLSTE